MCSGSSVGCWEWMDRGTWLCPRVCVYEDVYTRDCVCLHIWSLCTRCAAHMALFSTFILWPWQPDGLRGMAVLLLTHGWVPWRGSWSGASQQVFPPGPQAHPSPLGCRWDDQRAVRECLPPPASAPGFWCQSQAHASELGEQNGVRLGDLPCVSFSFLGLPSLSSHSSGIEVIYFDLNDLKYV